MKGPDLDTDKPLSRLFSGCIKNIAFAILGFKGVHKALNQSLRGYTRVDIYTLKGYT